MFIHSYELYLNKINSSHISFFSVIYVWSKKIILLLTKLWLSDSRFARGVLLPGAPDRAYLINKLIKQREQIYHLQL